MSVFCGDGHESEENVEVESGDVVVIVYFRSVTAKSSFFCCILK